ncbi:MAG: mannosyl-3-phosphoglycerate synthase [Candidatus Hydrothermota bacterium]|nr:MAG: mannosyl-3-phosphoglycerate synthase [Candidatus Hydrothermae bacterium]
MLLEAPIYKEIFGALIIHEVQKVLKLDTETETVQSSVIQNIPREDIYKTLKELAIVVPLKNEKLQLLDGVLKAIPHKSPIIIVSGSDREAPNRYKLEMELVKHFYNLTRSRVVMVHQKDVGVAEAFKKLDYTEILDEDSNVRSGKGEGMIIGTMLAKAIGAKYVGFVDADNYIPGSVNEYVKDYAAGFLMSDSEYTMVRLSWRHKPKVSKRGLYFRKWGRVSEITNRFLNLLMAEQTGFETNIIVTGNAGEHAMSIKLADLMEFSTGYSIEPHQWTYLLEKVSLEGEHTNSFKDALEQGIEIFQIETLNPHIHEEKGQEHIKEMVKMSLATIYHSPLCTKSLRERIIRDMKLHRVIEDEKELEAPRVMPPIGNIDVQKWMQIVKKKSDTLLILEP